MNVKKSVILLLTMIVTSAVIYANQQVPVNEQVQYHPTIGDEVELGSEASSTNDNTDQGMGIDDKYPYTMSDTIEGIKSVKAIIDEQEAQINKEISILQKNDDRFAPKDEFESNDEFLQRYFSGLSAIANVRNQYSSEIWSELGRLKARKFNNEYSHILLAGYDANTEKYTLSITRGPYQPGQQNWEIDIPKAEARILSKNWENADTRCQVVKDMQTGYKLFRCSFNEPVSNWSGSIEFPLMHDLEIYDIRSVAFSPTGKHLAFGSGGGVYVYNIQDWVWKQVLSVRGDTDAVCFSPNGKYLAVGGWRPPYLGNVAVYDLTTLTQVVNYNGKDDDVESFSFSPDSRFLAVGYNYNALVYDISANKLMKTFDVYSSSLAFSPDGRFLAIGGSDWSNALNIFDFSTMKMISQNVAQVNSLSFSPDGSYLAVSYDNVGHGDASLVLLNTTNWNLFKAITTNEAVVDVAFSKDNQHLVFGCENRAYVYKLGPSTRYDDIQIVESFVTAEEYYSTANSVSLSPDASFLVVNNRIYLTSIFK